MSLPWVSLFDQTSDDYGGYVTDLNQVSEIKRVFEEHTSTSYVSFRSTPEFGKKGERCYTIIHGMPFR